MKFSDVLSLAFRSVRSNKLRTGITITIIAFGIMALVGIITAIKAMNQKLTESFSTMGANGFTIRFKERNFHFGGDGGGDTKLSKKSAKKQKQSSLNKLIKEDEAEMFAQRYQFPGATVGLSAFSGRNNIASYRPKQSFRLTHRIFDLVNLVDLHTDHIGVVVRNLLGTFIANDDNVVPAKPE